MPRKEFPDAVKEICTTDTRYHPETYGFVREGLDHTIKSLKRHRSNAATSHVTGQELLNGLREYALREFGPMSKTVLNEWGVMNCEDFGQVVFNLVKADVLGKTDSDSLNDFKSGFSFDEAFVLPFQPRLVERVESKELAPKSGSRGRKSSLSGPLKKKTPAPKSGS